MASESFLSRVQAELSYWFQKDWSYESVGAHWDATQDYDAVNEATYSYQRRFEDGYRLSDIPKGSRVLDFCARTGNGSAFFHERGVIERAVCADVSFRMGEICLNRLEDIGLQDSSWVPVGGPVLPFKAGSFDAVLCFETIEHFPDPERLLAEIARVMQPGGVLILTTPNLLWEPVHALAAVFKLHHSEGPHRFISKRKLQELVAGSGFSINRSETTVLIPAGPELLIRFGQWMEGRTKDTLMPLIGLRRIVIAQKNGDV